MTDIDLDAISTREQAATPGPWAHHEFGSYGDHEPTAVLVVQGDGPDWWTAANDGEYVARLWWDSHGGADADFIAHARTDVPALIAAVQRRDDALAAVLALCNAADIGFQRDIGVVATWEVRAAITAHLAPADNPTTED